MADHVSPVAPDATFARVDQGVDYSQKEPYVSPGAGRVYAIGTGFAGPKGQPGANMAVYIKLDKPILVGNRAYDQIYIAETNPLVKVGQRVRAGQAVAAGGAAEIGFAHGASPLAPLEGGLGAGTKATGPGADFLKFVKGAGHQGPEVGSIPGTRSAQPQPQVDLSQLDQAAVPAGPPSPDATQPMILAPGSGAIADAATGGGGYITRLWSQIASQPNASPDTLAYVQNVNLVG